MAASTRNTFLAFLIPVTAGMLILGYYYQNRKVMMADLAKSGINAIFENGTVNHEDIRHYFHTPPTEDDSLLRVLEVTPEDLSGLEQEDAARLKEPQLQLLLSLLVKHIAIVKYFNALPSDIPTEEIEESIKLYNHSLMAEAMEKELRSITPMVTKAEMMDYYIKNRDEFHREGKRLARHLMFPEPVELSLLQPKIQRITDKIKQGEDFVMIASRESESESQTNGGMLGWQPQGVLHQSFENTLWSMDIGEITGPVHINDSIHFIQLMDIQEKGLMEFEDSIPQIQDELSEKKRSEEIYAFLGLSKETLLHEQPESTVEYDTKLLKEAYKNNWDQHTDTVTKVEAYTAYKKAALLFDNYVKEFNRNHPPEKEADNDWLPENQALENLMRDMNFHYLVQFDLPDSGEDAE